MYIKLIEQTLSQGKEAIVLIPEIALTYQTVRRFYARFGDKVSVINPDSLRENAMISLNVRKREKSR